MLHWLQILPVHFKLKQAKDAGALPVDNQQNEAQSDAEDEAQPLANDTPCQADDGTATESEPTRDNLAMEETLKMADWYEFFFGQDGGRGDIWECSWMNEEGWRGGGGDIWVCGVTVMHLVLLRLVKTHTRFYFGLSISWLFIPSASCPFFKLLLEQHTSLLELFPDCSWMSDPVILSIIHELCTPSGWVGMESRLLCQHQTAKGAFLGHPYCNGWLLCNATQSCLGIFSTPQVGSGNFPLPAITKLQAWPD